MKHYAIIVAGGAGKRMQNTVSKQFLLLNNLPVLMHTLNAFYNCSLKPQIFLVLNVLEHKKWAKLCETYNFKVPHTIVNGGQQRFNSVKNALNLLPNNALVAVHDGVRPLVSENLIVTLYQVAAVKNNAIAAILPTDSVRKLFGNNQNTTLNRAEIMLVQTPQTFTTNQLKKAYLQDYSVEFTDDASVVESNGNAINLVVGERNNIKITYPEDLELAEFLLKKIND